MTSLFDRDSITELPVDLVGRGGRAVTLLEFLSVGAQTDADAAAAAEETLPRSGPESDRASELNAMLEAARENARAETRRYLEDDFEARLQRERNRIAMLLVEFSEQRRSYFLQVEAAVVRLALTVAARILQREIDVDTMLLKATVRAALSRVHDGSAATMRVRPEEVGLWQQAFAEESSSAIEIAGDGGMRPGDCVLETTIGTIELGVESQLGEIERSFREHLQRAGAPW